MATIDPTSAIVQGASTMLGMGLDNTRQKQQYQNQVDLMGIQQGHQMALNKQGQEIAQQNWDYTNYENQKKHMENAGLNVGLMYGSAGQGGQSTSASGGSAASGQAPTINNSNAQMGLQLGEQLQLMKAQKENIQADTVLKEKEAGYTGGAKTENTQANTGNIKQDTENKIEQNTGLKLDNQLKNQGLEATLETLKANADKAQSEARSALQQANVDENTRSAKEATIKSNAANEAFKLTLMASDANLNNERARAVTQELAQEWEKLSIELEKVGTAKMQNAINEFKAKIEARLGTQNLEMRRIEAGLNAAGKILNKGINIDKSGSHTTVNNY